MLIQELATRPGSILNRQGGSIFKRRRQSVGSKGDSYGNALAETINGLYNTELIHRWTTWKTKGSLELATLKWVLAVQCNTAKLMRRSINLANPGLQEFRLVRRLVGKSPRQQVWTALTRKQPLDNFKLELCLTLHKPLRSLPSFLRSV